MAINTVPTPGGLKSVSASQINSYALGQRRWFLESQCKNRSGETPEMTLGTWAHTRCEQYLAGQTVTWPGLSLNGVAIDTTTTQASLLRLWADPKFPKPGAPSSSIEEPGNYALNISIAGTPVKGKIDYRSYADPTHHVVLDHKSTGNIDYAKTPEELAREPQIIVYAAYCVSKGADLVTAGHSTFQTKRGAAASVTMTDPMDRAHIESIYNGPLTKLVEDMQETVANYNGNPLDTPCHERGNPNAKSCHAFNRLCPFAELCGVGEFAGRDSSFTPPPSPSVVTATPSPFGPTMSLADKIRARGINPPDAALPAVTRPYVPDATPATVTATPAPTAATPAESWSSSSSPTWAPTTGLSLYVDCSPTKGLGVTLRLEDLVHERATTIAARHHVTDVREVDFGKGVAELVASFKKDPPTGVVVATSSGLSAYVVEVLLPIASVVVRGLR